MHLPVLAFRKAPIQGYFLPSACLFRTVRLGHQPSFTKDSQSPHPLACPPPARESQGLRRCGGGARIKRARGPEAAGRLPRRPAGQRRHGSARRAQRSQAGLRPLHRSSEAGRGKAARLRRSRRREAAAPPPPARPASGRPARSGPLLPGPAAPTGPRGRGRRGSSLPPGPLIRGPGAALRERLASRGGRKGDHPPGPRQPRKPPSRWVPGPHPHPPQSQCGAGPVPVPALWPLTPLHRC